MSTHEQVITRFAEQAGLYEKPLLKGDDFVFPESGGHHYGRLRRDTLYSYGHHFPLAVLMPDGDSPRGWWLLNGDFYNVNGRPSPSTRRHQDMTREAVKRTGLPYLTLSFTALREAGIDRDSIEPVHVLPDRYTWEKHVREDAPRQYELDSVLPEGVNEPNSSWYFRDWQQLEDGRWSYEQPVHHLGESVFRARYKYTELVRPRHMDLNPYRWVPSSYEIREGTAYFLSAFDENEPGNGLYFMAQMPDGAHPQTVAGAREAMKPDAVRFAERAGKQVLRQGDVFAIPYPAMPTRALSVPPLGGKYVLGVNHTVTEVRVLGSVTFGRGIMRHRPEGRRPEHRDLRLGDRRTWYELVKNTVPAGRSWALMGEVD